MLVKASLPQQIKKQVSSKLHAQIQVNPLCIQLKAANGSPYPVSPKNYKAFHYPTNISPLRKTFADTRMKNILL